MLLECLPSGRPSRSTGNNTGAIGTANPKTKQTTGGLCSPLGVQGGGGGLSRVGTAKNKGLNLLRLKCSETEPEWLRDILVFGV